MSDPRRPDHTAVYEDPGRFGLRVVGGVLHVEDVALERIADEVGTPVFVYGARHIEDRYRAMTAALAGHPATVCYAVKANSSQAVLRLLARVGAGADIVSGGELERVLAAGMDPQKVVFSGVGKRGEEIDAALRAGIRSINAESEEEIEHLARRARALGTRAPVSLRVNPDVDPHTHPYLATGMREAKFGVPSERALALALKVHETDELALVGLACHIGSQITDTRPFRDSLDRLRVLVEQLQQRGVALRQLDIGGGMGIPYTGEDPELDVSAWGAAVGKVAAALGLELVVEPGRYLVGNAGVLLTRVLGRKRGEERRFVIVDAAMNDLIRPALYQAYHTIAPTRWPDAAELERVDVVGPVCECGDFLATQRELPRAETGDLLAVMSAGAYAMSMASNYNTRPKAAEVMVSGSRWALIRPRRTVQDLIAEEIYPEWLAEPGPWA